MQSIYPRITGLTNVLLAKESRYSLLIGARLLATVQHVEPQVFAVAGRKRSGDLLPRRIPMQWEEASQQQTMKFKNTVVKHGKEVVCSLFGNPRHSI